MRLELNERMFANGNIHTALNEEEVEKACKFFIEEEVSSIAVCLINAYANNEHEKKIEKLLRNFGFKGYISCHLWFQENTENTKEQLQQ